MVKQLRGDVPLLALSIALVLALPGTTSAHDPGAFIFHQTGPDGQPFEAIAWWEGGLIGLHDTSGNPTFDNGDLLLIQDWGSMVDLNRLSEEDGGIEPHLSFPRITNNGGGIEVTFQNVIGFYPEGGILILRQGSNGMVYIDLLTEGGVIEPFIEFPLVTTDSRGIEITFQSVIGFNSGNGVLMLRFYLEFGDNRVVKIAGLANTADAAPILVPPFPTPPIDPRRDLLLRREPSLP